MEFFDCNTRIGRPTNPGVAKPVDAPGLLAAMDRAGIERALVWHVAQLDLDALIGNDLLTRAIAPHERLVGCWALLPNQAGELGDLDTWLRRAAESGVRALRAWPGEDGRHRYLLRTMVLRDVLQGMVARGMPLMVSAREPAAWPDLYDLAAANPELALILCDLHCWGSDRYFRPLVEKCPNVHIEIGSYMLDGGIEDFVAKYGPERMVFGTGFPEAYHGGMMLALAHAEISQGAKQAIAAGNLDRLLSGTKT